MMGYPGEPGIIPLAVREVFDYIDAVENMEFLLRVSCMEIYNEVQWQTPLARRLYHAIRICMSGMLIAELLALSHSRQIYVPPDDYRSPGYIQN